ncbi:MAG: DMT family transporter [Planctomycetota bacterium]
MKLTPGAPAMLASAMAFSVMSLLVKLAGERLPAAEIVFFRSVISLVLSYAHLRRTRRSPWGSQHGLLLLRGVLGFLALSCFFYAITELPLAEVTVIHYLNPVFTGVLAAIFLRERSGRLLGVSVATSLFGVILVTQPAVLFGHAADPLPGLPTLAALGGAVFGAAAYTVVRRLAGTEHPLVIVFYFPLVAVPASIPAFASAAVMPNAVEWLLLLGVGIATQVGQVALTRGLQLEPAGRATALSYSQVIFATLWGGLVFGAWPGPLAIGGGALVFAGTLLVAFRPATSKAD